MSNKVIVFACGTLGSLFGLLVHGDSFLELYNYWFGMTGALLTLAALEWVERESDNSP